MKLSALLFTLILIPFNSVFAKEGLSKPVDPVLYSVVKQQAYLDSVVTASDAANLTPERLYELVSKAQASTAVAAIGAITKKGNAYEALTGLTGAAVGKVVPGTYQLKGISVDSVEMVLPAKTVTIPSTGDAVITVVLKSEGNLGEVTYRKAPLNTWTKSIFTRAFWQSVGASLQKAVSKPKIFPGLQDSADVPVVVRVINDVNNNGELDPNEKLVPWANVIIQLTK